jgi:hypothetical protein
MDFIFQINWNIGDGLYLMQNSSDDAAIKAGEFILNDVSKMYVLYYFHMSY